MTTADPFKLPGGERLDDRLPEGPAQFVMGEEVWDRAFNAPGRIVAIHERDDPLHPWAGSSVRPWRRYYGVIVSGCMGMFGRAETDLAKLSSPP